METDMIHFTKEQMAVLAEYEPYFNTAVHFDYIRAITSNRSKVVADIWRSVKDPNYQFNDSCGGCVLDLFKMVGTPYYAQKELESIKPKKCKTKKK